MRGEAKPGESAVALMLGVQPAANDRPGAWPYFVRCNMLPEPGGSSLHVATGIQRLADARLIAAAPDLAAVLLNLLTTPDLMRAGLDERTCVAVTNA